MNITLIGMPGSGKSTVGKKIADKLSYELIEVDALIESSAGKTLQQIRDERGDTEFIALESETIQNLGSLQHTVISPGGSVIYAPEAMEFLKRTSTVVFLDVPLEAIRTRISMETRGIVGAGSKTLEEIYGERSLLYRRYADVVIIPVPDGVGPTSDRIIEALAARPEHPDIASGLLYGLKKEDIL